jgi:hypothetical protein
LARLPFSVTTDRTKKVIKRIPENEGNKRKKTDKIGKLHSENLDLGAQLNEGHGQLLWGGH